MKQFKFHILSFLTFVLFFGCTEKVSDPDSRMVLTVVDVDGAPIQQADVHLFDNLLDFTNFINSADASGRLQTGITNTEGQYTFCELEGVVYYFYVEKGESNNSDSQNRLGGALTVNATTYVQVKLDDYATQKIKFYSKDPSISANNIYIYRTDDINTLDIGTDFHTINKVGDGTSTDSDDFTYVYAPSVGVHTFYIKNDNGCVWMRRIEITDGLEIQPIELGSCNEQKFTFHSSDFVGGNIKVYLNDEEDHFATITGLGADCDSPNAISVYRPSGTYTYRAVHNNAVCTWIGTTGDGSVDAEGNVCIDLKDCVEQ